jgi:TolB-like protein
MKKRCLWLYLGVMLLISVMFPVESRGGEIQQTKVAVFNFGTMNLEASGYGTTITNMLMNALKEDPSLELLDRKELEAFLSLNDLQQDENLEYVIHIGSRLGINMIVAGNAGKKGSIISINCKVIHIDHRKVIFSRQIKSFGDAGLMGEVRDLSRFIARAMSEYGVKPVEDEKIAFQGPVNFYKRSGSGRVSLTWENPPGSSVSGYEVFRGTSAAGPFVLMGRVSNPGMWIHPFQEILYIIIRSAPSTVRA